MTVQDLSTETIDPGLLPSIMDVQGKKQLKVLVTHKYNTLPDLQGFITNIDPLLIWNLAASIQYYHSDYDEPTEGMDALQLVYLMCRFHNCIPYSAKTKYFDCTLDLYWNWEKGILNSDWESSGYRMWKEEYLSSEAKKEIERISKRD